MLLACADRAPDAPAITERDSAGVRIIENRGGLAAAPERWTLAAEPHVVIGTAADDSSRQLHEVQAAALLSDGTLVIANGGSNQLHVFDPAGEHVRSMGRDGEGPGEFRSLNNVWAGAGDTLFAWDYQLRRLSVFSAAGEFVRTVQPPSQRSHFAAGVLDDGSVVVAEHLTPSTMEIGHIADHEIELLRHEPSGATPDTLARHPHSRTLLFETPRGSVGARPLTFAPFTTVDVAGSRIAVVAGRAPEAWLWDDDEERVTLVRWGDALRPLSDADIARYEEQQLAEASDAAVRARVRERLRQEPYSKLFPAAERGLLEHDGHLWIERWREPWVTGPRAWTIFDAGGRLRAAVVVPEGLRVLDVRDDLLVGRMRDELDVEHVRVYRLDRRDRGG